MIKKIFFIFILIFPTVSLATTMCVQDDTLVISMYGEMKRGPGHEAPKEGIMWFDTDVGQLYFETTCLSESEGLGRTSGEGEFYGTGDYANTTITADKMQTGTDINGNERKYCWVRMIHPAASAWVLVLGMSDSDACAGSCFGQVYRKILYYGASPTFRGILKSIGK